MHALALSVSMNACMCTRAHTHTHTYARTHTHAHTHIHTHTSIYHAIYKHTHPFLVLFLQRTLSDTLVSKFWKRLHKTGVDTDFKYLEFTGEITGSGDFFVLKLLIQVPQHL